MKRILIIILAISLWSCQSNVGSDAPNMPESKGQLKSSFFADDAIRESISITISQGDEVVERWNTIDDVPEVVSLVPGSYTITAKTEGDMLLLSYKPYYNASTDFTIVEDGLAYAALECKMLNMKVDVSLSEELEAEFPEWHADLFFLDNIENTVITFTPENNKTIYLAPAPFGVTLKDMATSESRTVIFEEFGAAMYHNVKFQK